VSVASSSVSFDFAGFGAALRIKNKGDQSLGALPGLGVGETGSNGGAGGADVPRAVGMPSHGIERLLATDLVNRLVKLLEKT
jgi:hypothetical protein